MAMWAWNSIKEFFQGIQDQIDAANWGLVSAHLQTKIFGQHIAVKEVFKCIYEHLYENELRKALVIICNGSVGTGKTYFGNIIAKYGFRNGLANPAVKLINGPRDFPDSKELSLYKENLKTLVEETVKKHRRCFFLFDEVDKMPSGVLDVLTPYVDTYEQLDGVDYRKCVFMFISNRGGSRIEEIVLDLYNKQNLQREHLSLHHFRKELETVVLSETGGLQGSQLISKKLIDPYVPFLPLEKYNIIKCLEAAYERMGCPPCNPVLNFAQIAEEKLDYGPEENKIFAKDGAKNVDIILNYEFELRHSSLS